MWETFGLGIVTNSHFPLANNHAQATTNRYLSICFSLSND